MLKSRLMAGTPFALCSSVPNMRSLRMRLLKDIFRGLYYEKHYKKIGRRYDKALKEYKNRNRRGGKS
jgi:hypothetical protein